MSEPIARNRLAPADLIEHSQWDFFWVPDDATVVDRPELLYVRCPRDLPLLNCASRTLVDHRIDALVKEVATAHTAVTSRWLVRDRPDRAELEAALARRGYAPGYEHGAFAMEVSGRCGAAKESEAEVRSVRDMNALLEWYLVADKVFGMDAGHPQHELERFLRECTGPAARVHRFVAYHGDSPVSCGGMTSFPSIGFGYLWAGATLESARGRGFYRAVLEARVSHARQLGLSHVGVYARVGTSAPIVRKVGFEQVGDMCYWDRAAQRAAGIPRGALAAAVGACVLLLAHSAAASPPDLPPVKIPLVVSSFLIQYPLMIGVPIALGLWLRKRLNVPLWVWAVGMASFVASQVVHIPLNALLGIGAGGGLLGHLPLPAMSVVIGLSAGLCEELARYAAMRLIMTRQTGWSAAVLFGAGHGGVEAILFGLLAAYSLLGMLALPYLGDVAQDPSVQAAAWSYWTNDWYVTIYAGVERMGAMMSHIGMSVLVMRAVTRRNLLYLLAAIGAHTLIDALILPFKAAGIDDLWLELVGVTIGGALLAVALWLREPEPAT